MMWGMKCAAVLAVVATSVGGCSTFEGYPDPPSGEMNALENVDKLLYTTLQRYSTEGNEVRRQDIRNALIRQRMVEIDFAYQTFEKKLHAENLRGSVYTDWASTALTAAVPGTGSTHSKDVLAGLSTFLTTSKSIYDSKVLAESTMPALIAEMRTSRAKSRAALLKKLQNSVGEYDIYSAWSDLNRYYEAGTLPSAITSLNSAAISRSAIADTENTRTPTAESLALDSLLLTAPSESDMGDAPNDRDNTTLDGSSVATPAAPASPPVPDRMPMPNPLTPVESPSPTNTPAAEVSRVSVNMSKPAETLGAWIHENQNNLYRLEDWLREQGQRMVVAEFLRNSTANEELQRKAIKALMKPSGN